jgi:processive 1,2-diacylglycerol beta-glucosyltransferase
MTDAYIECGRFPVNRFPGMYALLASRYPRLWSLVYGTTSRRGNPDLVLAPFLREGFARLIRRERPDVVVSVLPAINGLLAQVARRVEVVLTDWAAVHRFWAAAGVAHYTVPTEAARDEVVSFGASPRAIDVIGIPVRREFATSNGTARLPKDRPKILAMVGAEGSPRAMRNIAALAHSGIGSELVVVCGRSQRLRRAAAALPVTALGYVEDVANLMRSADVLVTKAGGLTLAEAFCCRVPVVVHDVVPGQETGNLEYMLEVGAVAYARSPLGLVATVRDLIERPDRRARLAACGAELARPDAAEQIAANVLSRV